jgi:hypothetical protein
MTNRKKKVKTPLAHLSDKAIFGEGTETLESVISQFPKDEQGIITLILERRGNEETLESRGYTLEKLHRDCPLVADRIQLLEKLGLWGLAAEECDSVEKPGYTRKALENYVAAGDFKHASERAQTIGDRYRAPLYQKLHRLLDY